MPHTNIHSSILAFNKLICVAPENDDTVLFNDTGETSTGDLFFVSSLVQLLSYRNVMIFSLLRDLRVNLTA